MLYKRLFMDDLKVNLNYIHISPLSVTSLNYTDFSCLNSGSVRYFSWFPLTRYLVHFIDIGERPFATANDIVMAEMGIGCEINHTLFLVITRQGCNNFITPQKGGCSIQVLIAPLQVWVMVVFVFMPVAAKPLLAGYLAVYLLVKGRYFVEKYRHEADTTKGAHGHIYPAGAGMGQDIIKVAVFL